MGSKYTEAQKRATAKYHAENLEMISIRTPKGTKDRWKAKADAQGKSLAKLIIDAVEEYEEG